MIKVVIKKMFLMIFIQKTVWQMLFVSVPADRVLSAKRAASAHSKAEAEKSVLVECAAALKDQEQQLGRKREQLELEAEIAATTAKPAIL